jgi:hypothetical protein
MKDLDLASDQYLVFSGGTLAAHEIRETSDVDVVVTQSLFAELKETSEWKHTNRCDGTEFLDKGDVEIASKLELEDYPVTLAEAKSREDIIDGIPFMNLKDFIQFKQAYGRKKDKKDIKLINNYLNT